MATDNNSSGSSSSSSSNPPLQKKTQTKNESGRSSYMLKIFFLLTILAHGIMFSSRSLRYISLSSFDKTSRSMSSKEIEMDGTTFKSIASSMLNTNTDYGTLRSSSHSRTTEQIPHWRMAVDCSVYSLDCFSRRQRENRYLPYPFPPKSSASQEFQTEILQEFPKEWLQRLQSQPITNYSQHPAVSIQDAHNLYPSTVAQDEYQKCMEFTGIQGADESSKSTLDQLDEILASGRLSVEPDTNMIAFTISDYTYTHDMLHDIFQMMNHIVGFSTKHFFLVAIDVKTVEMACRHGYPVLFWRESNNENLRDAVANTKFVLSLELVKRGIDFFFTEMDVWWIRSPKQSLLAFQDVSSDQTIENHLYFSAHQNNPRASNIGVYAAKANDYTKEYFEICIDVLKQRPETHDQWAMQQVGYLYESTLKNQSFEFGGNWGEKGPPPVPSVKFPFTARLWGPHEIVADERPTPTLESMAIHTLCHTPLLNPHGKKMIAREIGAYYGFKTSPTHSLVQERDVNVKSASNDAAGYYARTGDSYRRYVVLDSSLRTNFYSTSPVHMYHNTYYFQWIAAVLMAIAKWSDRILILPQVFQAIMDAGSYFSWNIMDYSKVNDFIDTRECNFLSNPKSWANDEGSNDWPFVSAAVTAFLLDEESNTATIYSQVTNRSHIVSQNAWQVDALDERIMIDAYAASLLFTDSIKDAEILFVNPDFMLRRGFIERLADRSRLYQAGTTVVGHFEREVFEIYDLLGWCWEEGSQHTVSKTSASHSCYAAGRRGRRRR